MTILVEFGRFYMQMHVWKCVLVMLRCPLLLLQSVTSSRWIINMWRSFA